MSRKWFSILSLLAIVSMATLSWSGQALASHAVGAFELDGNANVDPNDTVAGDDWNLIAPTKTSSTVLATSFAGEALEGIANDNNYLDCCVLVNERRGVT